jgi:hypothetical protein
MTTPIKIKPAAIECPFFYARSLLGDYRNCGNDKFLEAHINGTAGEKKRADIHQPRLTEMAASEGNVGICWIQKQRKSIREEREQ